jgi:hypothetical protein
MTLWVPVLFLFILGCGVDLVLIPIPIPIPIPILVSVVAVLGSYSCSRFLLIGVPIPILGFPDPLS